MDPGGASLAFQRADKYRFLREFALHATLGPYGFDEFTKTDLINFCKSLAPDLNAVRDPVAFVEEIIRSSGLLNDIAEDGRYVFAHRSIQEYLAADQLGIEDSGDSFLLDRANDPEWRQIILFHATIQEQRHVNAFLTALAQLNPKLAAYCLASATASDAVAIAILDALEPIDGISLPALAAATMSPRLTIQDVAIRRLEQALVSRDRLFSEISGEIDSMLPLLGSLASTNAARIASLIPDIIRHIPDDPRLVEPLWRCLAARDIEAQNDCPAIIQRLITLVVEPDAMEELSRQDPYIPKFLTADLRHRAYPFANGLDPNHNLVTLLSWAEHLDVVPNRQNRFFQAKAHGRLDTVEADRRRTLVVSLFWPAMILLIGGSLTAISAAIVVLVAAPHQLVHPFGLWTLLVIFGAAVISFAIYLFFHSTYGVHASDAPTDFIADTLASYIPRGVIVFIFFLVLPVACSVATSGLIMRSLVVYFALTGTVGSLLLLTNLDFCGRERHYYLYRPNPFVEIYEDPYSRHWVTKSSDNNTVV